MTDIAPILTQRLELVSMSVEVAEALLQSDLARANRAAGLELPDSWSSELGDLLRARIDGLRRDPALQQWLVRIMVLRDPTRTVVGNLGFHGPPRAAGEVEVGYSVVPAFQRRGYATEAVKALCDWAARQHGITRFVATVSPTNAASLAVVAKLGFAEVGRTIDDREGEQLVFELRRHA